MAATTTPSTNWLINALKRDYPGYSFVESSGFQWSPSSKTIEFSVDDFDEALILHELGHAECGHRSYSRDIELLRLERQAWTMARKIAKDYQISIDQDKVEDQLDSYRDWLHSRSTCPSCSETGLQTAHQQYSCPACSQTWHVNDARNCQLRRTLIT